MGLSSEIDINVVHRYSYLGEHLLHTTYNDLGVKLTGALQICDGCAIIHAKERAVIKKTYTRALQMGERFVLDTTDPLPESLFGDRYWIGVVDDYSRYSWSLFTKQKVSTSERDGRVFENMTSRGTPVKCLCCNNAG